MKALSSRRFQPISVIVQPVVEQYTALTLTLAGAADLLDGELAGPPRHVEGAALQLAALLARHPQAPAREPGERTPTETVGKQARMVNDGHGYRLLLHQTQNPEHYRN